MRKEKIVTNLCTVGDYDIRMIATSDGATKLSEDITVFLVDRKTGIPCMGENRPGLVLKKKAILDEKEIFGQLREFDVPLSVDHLKMALETAQNALLSAEKNLELFDSPSILEIYRQVVQGALEHAEECDDKEVPFILKRPNALWIRKEMLTRLLDKAGSRLTCTGFCKQLLIFGAAMDTEILSRSEKNRYDSLTTLDKTQKRFFRINILPSLMRGGLKNA